MSPVGEALARESSSAAPSGERGSPIRPPALERGDTIALIAPAGKVVAARVREAVRNIERRGYTVRVLGAVHDEHGYLAGVDRVRARDLHEAFRDSRVKLVLCLRGGYGSPRLLELVDYDLVRRHPKVFVGYSDITALLVAMREKAGLTVFHGPMAMGDFSGKYGLAPFATRHFWSLIEAGKEESFEARAGDWGADAPANLGKRFRIAPGVAEGELIGGNLSTVAALMGTPYEIDTEDRILLLEDVNEEPFRIDRMLCQLHLAGKLAQCRGILLGAFVRCEARPGASSLTVEQVLEEYLGGLGIPVLAGFPAGHLPQQAMLPMGSRVRLDADNLRLTLLERPVADVTAGAGG